MLALLAIMAGATQAVAQTERHRSNASSSSAPATLRPCRDCPEFVLTPPPPATAQMRNIRYVAKYELTWRSYLASVDAHACPIPTVEAPRFGSEPEKYNQIDPDNYRIDWPMAQFTRAEVECYLWWLQSKTDYIVALPSAREWEWFARAGNPTARFPWGDDDGPGHEQLYGTPARVADMRELVRRGLIIPGRPVGQFAPNAWGIHDLMGNVRELTSDIMSGEDWRRLVPSEPPSMLPLPRVTIKGSTTYDRDWASDGIARDFYTPILNGRYAADVAVRIVLIDRNEIQ
jgi:hypothetical protein